MGADDLLVIDNNSPTATKYHPHSEDIAQGPDGNEIKRSIVAIDAPSVAVSPTASTSLQAKASAGRFMGLQATNNSTDTPGFVVVCDLPAIPTGTSPPISPKKWAKIPISDGTLPGTVDLDLSFAFATGCSVLLTTSLTNFTPGNMTGLISTSYF